MNQIIAIQTSNIGMEARETVNARELHEFLEVATRFNDWIVARIKDFDFQENQDFVIFTENPVKGRPSKEYALTLDMAKELSMVERNEKGKQARQYFIECERRAKDPMAALQDPATMRTLLLSYSDKIIQRDKLIADIAPKAAIADKLLIADGLYNLTHAAKLLNIPPRKFNQQLQSRNWIYRMGVIGAWTGRAEKIKSGYLHHKINEYAKGDGSIGTNVQVMVTPKGMHRLASIFNVEFQEAA